MACCHRRVRSRACFSAVLLWRIVHLLRGLLGEASELGHARWDERLWGEPRRPTIGCVVLGSEMFGM